MQKKHNIFTFQRFIMILSEHLVRCDTDGVDFRTPWYNWTIGRLQQIFLMVRVGPFLSMCNTWEIDLRVGKKDPMGRSEEEM